MPRMSCGRPARSGLKRSKRRSSSGRTLYFARLDQEQALQLAQPVGLLGGEVVAPASSRRARRAPRRRRRTTGISAARPTGCCAASPRSSPRGRCRGCRTSRSTASSAGRRRRRRRRCTPSRRRRSGCCWTPLTLSGAGSRAASSTVGGDVDHVVELRADLAACLDPGRPVHDRAVARAAPVRRDLLRPLVRRVHRVRPADGVVVVGRGGAEVVDLGDHELRRLEPDRAVQDRRAR